MATSARSPFISIRTKLAATTVVLIAAISTAGYVGLSRHERENLLAAKTTAATMMAGLFNTSVATAIAFDDAKDVQEGLKNLGGNDEVMFAAVFGIDAEVTTQVGAKLGALERGNLVLAPPVRVPPAALTRRTSEWVLVESPVRDPAGKVTGVSQIAFSLARENAAIQVVERRALGLFAALALGLSIVLLGVAQIVIVRPLRRLAVATKRLEQGEHVEIGAIAEDEIGALARAFQTMSSAIKVREVQISSKNRDLRLVLDNVEEGFLTVGRDGTMSDERSAILDRWFGPPSSNALLDYLTRIDSDLGTWFSLGWEALIEDLLPLELTLEQLPRSFTRDGHFFEIAYRPIFDGGDDAQGGTLSKLLVIISDVTARREREHADISRREMATIFERVLTDRAGFEEFFAEASALVDAIEHCDATADAILRRQIHTLKGNVAFFGLERVAALCHELESGAVRPGVEGRAQLRALWDDVAQMAKRFARPETNTIEVRTADYEGLLEALRAGVDPRRVEERVRSWRHEAVETRFGRLADQVRRLARRLDRGDVMVKFAPTSLRTSTHRWAPFWSSLVHVVRNVVDHGIESQDERALSHKTPLATITLAAEEVEQEVRLVITDDGRGIDWVKIATIAAARGLPHETKDDLEQALYADGISTREAATETSGRGVGMSAVREAVVALGGRVEVESLRGIGTTFRFAFPRAMFEGASNPPVRLALVGT